MWWQGDRVSSSSPQQQPPRDMGVPPGSSQPLLPVWGGLPVVPCNAAAPVVQDKVHSAQEHSCLQSAVGLLGQCVLISHVLSNISLMEHHDGHGVHLPALLRGLSSHSKALGENSARVRDFPHTSALESTGTALTTHQGDVSHGVHHHALVLGCVLCDAAQA